MTEQNPNPSPTLPFSGEGAKTSARLAAFSPLTRGAGGGSCAPLILNQRTTQAATDSVALAYDERKRSRLKVTLASGAEAGIFLERGDHLQHGDKLAAENGDAIVEIIAAPEMLIEAVADASLLFARAAYHLGNRHVPVQIIPEPNGGRLRFQTDHVLAEMVRGLGCLVQECEAPFQPEAGAYGAHRRHAHGEDEPAPDLHNPGHGPHRSVPKIHQFKPR